MREPRRPGLDKAGPGPRRPASRTAPSTPARPHAWWASLLPRMLRPLWPRSAASIPARLRTWPARGRELWVASLIPQAITGVRRIHADALARLPSQYEGCVNSLPTGKGAQRPGSMVTYPLVRHLLPVLMTVPSMVPAWLHGTHRRYRRARQCGQHPWPSFASIIARVPAGH